jgi:DNA-binding HxlR family transcriptional regulator
MGGEMNRHETHCYELAADCQLRAATDLFAHTWDPVVLAALGEGTYRRRELRAAIGGVSDKALTDALHRLLANGLIARRAYAEAPPRVEYALTPLGTSLVDGPMRALGRWAQEHGDELLAAQEASLARETSLAREA